MSGRGSNGCCRWRKVVNGTPARSAVWTAVVTFRTPCCRPIFNPCPASGWTVQAASPTSTTWLLLADVVVAYCHAKGNCSNWGLATRVMRGGTSNPSVPVPSNAPPYCAVSTMDCSVGNVGKRGGGGCGPVCNRSFHNPTTTSLLSSFVKRAAWAGVVLHTTTACRGDRVGNNASGSPRP